MSKTIVITSGYYNPIHPGHIECLELCRELGDELRVIVNSDHQAKLKTGKSEIFQDENFRMRVVGAIKGVDEVVLAIDQDWSVVASIENVVNRIKEKYWDSVNIIFGKGGDRFAENIPEVQVCRTLGIEIRDWLWAKTHHSSDLRAKTPAGGKK